MKVFTFNDRLFWMAAREGKITGSRLKNIVAKRDNGKKKIGFYQLIAEKLGVPSEDGETDMERGSRLEQEGIKCFEELTGKKVDSSLILWTREDNENIAVSPDGVVIPKKKGAAETEAVEVKCLSAANHIKAYLEQEVPEEYWLQVLQYFIVNEHLKKLHFVCYDPRFDMVDPDRKKKLSFFAIEVNREDVEGELEDILATERETMKEVDAIVNELTF